MLRGRFAVQVQFLRHEEAVRLRAGVAFGDGEHDGDFCRRPLLGGLEHLNPKPVHRVRRHIVHLVVVQPQKRQLSFDPSVHGYPRLKRSFLPNDTSGRSSITSSGASVRSFWSESTSMTPCEISQPPSAAISSVLFGASVQRRSAL